MWYYAFSIANVMFKWYCMVMKLVTNPTFNGKYKDSTGICSYNKSQRDAQFLKFI